MEYQSILKRIEDEKKERYLSAKVFRYAGLIQAIEFFSQKLNFDQIVEAAFDFTNELLTLQKSAIFIKQENNFVLRKMKGYANESSSIENSSDLQNLARFYGNLLCDENQLLKYFNKKTIDEYCVTTVIPLIIDDLLYGFIFISSKAIGEFDDEDYIISEALMKLINNALEDYKRYEDLQSMNKELDEKVFNLFAINHSSKALLSELSLDALYQLSVDVFTELTQSSVTGFVLFDEKSEMYTLRAYKDIFNFNSIMIVSLTPNSTAKIDLNRITLKMSDSRDIAYFNSIFNEGIETLNMLKSEYIVLLLKDNKVLGFVSLGPTTTKTEYKKGIFELTESLASAAYVALSNAELFKCVNEQKAVIEEKLKKLISLNKLTKNLNSSLNKDNLMELTLKTLEVSFETEKALIATFDKEARAFNVEKTLNVEFEDRKIKINSAWKKVLEGDLVYDAKENGIHKYINKSLLKDTGESSGILIVPIYLDRLEIEILGVIVIFKFRNALINNEESILTIETIAGHIAPVMSSLSIMEEQQRFLQPNYMETFKKDLQREISDAENFTLYLSIVFIECKNKNQLFEENKLINKLKSSFKKVYPFSNDIIFIILNGEGDNAQKIKQLEDVESVKARVLTRGKDFNSYEQFMECFNL